MSVKNINRVELLGRLGRDPEVTRTKSGMKRAKASLATSAFKKTGDEGFGWKRVPESDWLEKTSWHRLLAWGDQAEELSRYEKGALLHIVGNLEYSESGEGSEKKYWTDIVVREVEAVKDERRPRDRDTKPARAKQGRFQDDEDVPF